MKKHLIAQQSSVKVGSICTIFNADDEENNGLTVVAYNVYFECGCWWADVFHYFNEKLLVITEEDGSKKRVDKAAFPATMLMSVGYTDLETETELEEIK